MEQQGFSRLASAALIAQHSIVTQLAAGRPDEQDPVSYTHLTYREDYHIDWTSLLAYTAAQILDGALVLWKRGENLSLIHIYLGLLLGGAGEDDAALGGLLGLHHLQNDAVS